MKVRARSCGGWVSRMLQVAAAVAAFCGQAWAQPVAEAPVFAPAVADVKMDSLPGGTVEVEVEGVVQGMKRELDTMSTSGAVLRLRRWFRAWSAALVLPVVLASSAGESGSDYWERGVGFGRLELAVPARNNLGILVALPVPLRKLDGIGFVGVLYPAFSASIYGGGEVEQLGIFAGATLDIPGNMEFGEYGNFWDTSRVGAWLAARRRSGRGSVAPAIEANLTAAGVAVGARLQVGARIADRWHAQFNLLAEHRFVAYGGHWDRRVWAMIGMSYLLR